HAHRASRDLSLERTLPQSPLQDVTTMRTQSLGIVFVALMVAAAVAGDNSTTGGFQAELDRGQQLCMKLSEEVAGKRMRESTPSQAYLRAQQAIENFASRLNSAAETAHALIPASKSEDRGVRSAAQRALLQLSSQLRGLREHTEREVNA